MIITTETNHDTYCLKHVSITPYFIGRLVEHDGCRYAVEKPVPDSGPSGRHWRSVGTRAACSSHAVHNTRFHGSHHTGKITATQ